MISVGNKIEIIVSSTRSKGTKIRKGSIGYISTVGKIYCIGTRKSTHGDMFIVPAKVVITRFGNEAKERNEVKFVSLVYPTVDPKQIKNKRTYLTKLTKQALDYTKEIQDIFKSEGISAKNVPAVVVHTLNGTENIIKKKTEYQAWFRSIAISGILHNILYCPPMDARLKTLNKLINGDFNLLNNLREGINSRNNTIALVDDLFAKGKKEVNAFTIRMQEVLQLDKLHKLHEMRQNCVPYLQGGGNIFSMCWQLHVFGLKNDIKSIANRSHTHKHYNTLALTWLNIYTDLMKKSI